jgi:hypothetical protein
MSITTLRRSYLAIIAIIASNALHRKIYYAPLGGREGFGHKFQRTTYRYDVLYYDIATDQRIVYSHEM